MTIDWGYVAMTGAVRTIPLAVGFGTLSAVKNRGWGNWGSAFAASGAALVAGVGALWLENQLAGRQAASAIQEMFGEGAAAMGMSGIGQRRVVRRRPANRRFRGLGQPIMTPGDVTRAGYFTGLGRAYSQRVP